MSITLASLVAPAAAVTPLVQTDVAAFTSRAEAWTQARNDYREDAREQALSLAETARQAEADRIAAEEAAALVAAAERRAAEEAATTTTTTPPTTLPPTTAAPTTLPPTTAAPTGAGGEAGATTPVAPAAPGEPTAAQWEQLRQCESSGNYGAVSSNSRYRGAYQFSQATWDWIAGLDHPALVGVDPAAASASDQDAMARSLWLRRGWSPWPICGGQASAA